MSELTAQRLSGKANTSDRSAAIITLSVAMWGILVLSGVEYVAAIKIVLVVAAQVFAGAVAYLSVGRWVRRPLPELLGMGFAIGSMLSVVADQVSRLISVRSIGWAIPFAAAVIIALIRRSKDHVDLPIVDIGHTYHEFETIIGIVVFSIIALTSVWNWMKFPAMGTLPILIYIFSKPSWPKFSRSRHLMLTGIASTCVLGVYAITSRPQYWWLPSWGIDENEILAHSIYNWGPNDYALSAGIPLKYQWTSHAWMGLVTHISGADNFVLVSRAAFVITAIVIICVVWALTLRVTGSTQLALLATFVVSVSSTAISYPAAYSLMAIGYSSFALVCILAFFIAFIDWYKAPTLLFLLLVMFLAISVVASKSVQILTLGSGVAAVGLYDFWHTRKLRILVGAFLIGVSTIVFATLTFPSTKGTGITRSAFASFTSEFAVDPYTHSLKVRLLVTATVLVSLLGIPLIGAIGILRNRAIRHVGVFLVGAFSTGIPMAVFTTRVSATQMHFIQVPIMLGLTPAIAWSVGFFAEHKSSLGKHRFLFPFLLTISFLAFPIALVSKVIVSDGLTADNQFTFFTNKVTAAVLVVAFLLAGIAYFVYRFMSRERFPILYFVTACLVASSVSMFFASWETNPRRGINETGATYQLGQHDLREATDWVKLNTGINAIFASNSFFGEDADDRCGESITTLSGPVTEEATKTNYFTTAVTLKRRLIAAGVGYTFLLSGDPTERVRASILFACYPDTESLRELHKFDVAWFLAYRNKIDPAVWSKFGKVRFLNAHYAVIELD